MKPTTRTKMFGARKTNGACNPRGTTLLVAAAKVQREEEEVEEGILAAGTEEHSQAGKMKMGRWKC